MKILAKALILVGLVGAQPAWAPTDEFDFWGNRLVKLIGTLDLLARKGFGCPMKGDFKAGDCRREYGLLDYMLLRQSKEQAMKFFDLEDRR